MQKYSSEKGKTCSDKLSELLVLLSSLALSLLCKQPSKICSFDKNKHLIIDIFIELTDYRLNLLFNRVHVTPNSLQPEEALTKYSTRTLHS